MSTTVHPHRKSGELIATVHVVKLSVTDAYIKVTEKSLTMSAPTVMADLRTYQLVWSVAMQIVYGNPRGHN